MLNGLKLTDSVQPRLGTVSTPTNFALIGVALAAVVGTFAYLGGWLTPHALTPARFVDAFEQVDGVHPGFRRNHAKGLGVSGLFESNGNGVRLSKAVVFQPGRVPVIGRFSLRGRPALRGRHAGYGARAWACSFRCPTANCGEPR